LRLDNVDIKIKNLISNSAKSRQLTLVKSSVELSQESVLSNASLTIDAGGSVLSTNGTNVILDWVDIGWNGKLELNQSTTIKGNNSIDSLTINAGSNLSLASGTEQTVTDLEIVSLVSSPVKISSDGNAVITVSQHKKFCFDYMNITNVETKGVGVMNAGENATLTNAKGWNAQKCEEVLFADFEIKYPCENGMTLFTDKSSGYATQWNWSFPGQMTATGKEAAFSFLASNTYPVSLSINDGSSSQTYSAQVYVMANSIKANQIVANSDEIYSFNQASGYQWYRNGAAISAETKRSYQYDGSNGVYFVVTYDDLCNRISEPLTVTGLLEENHRQLFIYPNPSNEMVTIESGNDEIDFVTIFDLLGRDIASVQSFQRKMNIPLTHLNDGIYLLEVSIKGNKYRERILIKH
jgi:hypothetical protein